MKKTQLAILMALLPIAAHAQTTVPAIEPSLVAAVDPSGGLAMPPITVTPQERAALDIAKKLSSIPAGQSARKMGAFNTYSGLQSLLLSAPLCTLASCAFSKARELLPYRSETGLAGPSRKRRSVADPPRQLPLW